MNARRKIVLTTLAVTALLMALHPIGPLGSLLWPEPAPDAPRPEGAQLPLLLLLFLAEAAASAFGLAYLLFGWPTTRGLLPESPRLALAAHASLAFLLLQWWPHGNLHMSVPFSFGAILAIDHLFHVPMMLASLTIVAALAARARQEGTGARAAGRAGAVAEARGHGEGA